MAAAAILSNSPLRILHEVCTKRGIRPEFELLLTEGERHKPIFTYKVTVQQTTAVGSGKSKHRGKRAAAEAMLHKLMYNPERKCDEEDLLMEIGEVKNEALTFDEQEVITGNPVGGLQELCVSRQWPYPNYEWTCEGPAYNRIFTVTCYVLGHAETGSGRAKKKAKRTATIKILNKMLVSTEHSGPGLNKMRKQLKDLELHFSSLKESKIPTLTESEREEICQFHRDLGRDKGEKLTELQNMQLNPSTFSSVQYLLEISAEEQFSVKYQNVRQKSSDGELQCLVHIASLPLACCGHGATSKEAMFSAAQCALEYLKITTKS